MKPDERTEWAGKQAVIGQNKSIQAMMIGMAVMMLLHLWSSYQDARADKARLDFQIRSFKAINVHLEAISYGLEAINTHLKILNSGCKPP